jgi:hypothetical protein
MRWLRLASWLGRQGFNPDPVIHAGVVYAVSIE